MLSQGIVGRVGTDTTSTSHTLWRKVCASKVKVDILQHVWRCDNQNLESGEEILLLIKLHYFIEIWEADIASAE